jgi:hypothetical protein
MHPSFLPALNSASAYPSIETYHVIGDKGRLTEDRNVVFGDDVFVTEKVDGTNARIILEPLDSGLGPSVDWIIGSRKELLHAAGDLIFNPSEGIVEAVRDLAPKLMGLRQEARVVVVFGEVYGGRKMQAWKQYTSKGDFGFRVFDIADFDARMLGEDRAKIASWRDHGGQGFLVYEDLVRFATELGLDFVPELEAPAPPEGLQETADWLAEYAPKSMAMLDPAAMGRAEGVVVRSPDRSQIAKIRFEDYDRTLGRRRR